MAHGSVRTGKTVCTTFAFLHAAWKCPDSKIYIVGHTFDTAYRNVVRLIMESTELAMFRPYCTWSGKKLFFADKTITVLGAKDEGAIGNFQGDTHSVTYCDEITLYPESIIDMIDSRLSQPHSIAFASMNPSHPSHKVKGWIDKAIEGDPNYYQLHFTLEDNPYVPQEYKNRLRDSASGIFYKRNYLGLWCMAEGAIFDFFDRKIHVVKRPPRAAEYWIAGIDYGTNNSFACVLIGVSTGVRQQIGKSLWVEKEYYWDSVKKGRQKTNLEYAKDVRDFLGDYDVKGIYVDPSAASFKLELRRMGMTVIDAENEVVDGINHMASEMHNGTLLVCENCTNIIREIEGYVWDPSAAKKGEDKPLKVNDHAVDAARYALYTHKVPTYTPYKDTGGGEQYMSGRFNPGTRRF